MTTRVIRIPARSERRRRALLAELEPWMAKRGWSLADYADELGSAAFAWNGEGQAPSRLHPSRWIVAPLWRPRVLLLRVFSAPGAVLVLLLAAAVVAGTLWLPAGQDAGDTGMSAARAEAERRDEWLYVNADALNLRAGPSTEHDAVGVLFHNQRVQVGQTSNGWVRILRPERGWVARRFLQKEPAR